MGVRLYINTNLVATLEACAGVPAGTKKRYDQFLLDTELDDSYEAYCKCKADAELYAWNQFQLFGFGKFDYPTDDSGRATGMIARAMWRTTHKQLLYGTKAVIIEAIALHGVYWA